MWLRFEHLHVPSLNRRLEMRLTCHGLQKLPLPLSHRGLSCPPPRASPPGYRDDLGSLMLRSTFYLALLSDTPCYSSRQIPGLNKLKLLHGPGGEPMTDPVKVALLHALFALLYLSALTTWSLLQLGHLPCSPAIASPRFKLWRKL